jgi:hypothetical protein
MEVKDINPGAAGIIPGNPRTLRFGDMDEKAADKLARLIKALKGESAPKPVAANSVSKSKPAGEKEPDGTKVPVDDTPKVSTADSSVVNKAVASLTSRNRTVEEVV